MCNIQIGVNSIKKLPPTQSKSLKKKTSFQISKPTGHSILLICILLEPPRVTVNMNKNLPVKIITTVIFMKKNQLNPMLD